jgi:hypothetical protein
LEGNGNTLSKYFRQSRSPVRHLDDPDTIGPTLDISNLFIPSAAEKPQSLPSTPEFSYPELPDKVHLTQHKELILG